LAPGETGSLTLVVSALGDAIDAPSGQVLVGSTPSGLIEPRTVAPRPRPGPASAVTIASLGLRASVVSTPWDPPPFVVGQLQGSANLSQGNSVLLGHLGGRAGDVFAHLDNVHLGDEVVAISRGLDYHFVVSQTEVLPATDQQPLQPTGTPRLTLMTCTGTWNPITQDYSHRLWVIAEPPDLARETITANAARAAQATATARAAPTATPQPTAQTAVPSPANAQVYVAPPPTLTSVTGLPTIQIGAFPDGTFPTPPRPRPAPGQTPNPSQTPPLPLGGLAFSTPTDGSTVPGHVTLRGTRRQPAQKELQVWLLVRAESPGSRWYAHPHPLTTNSRGEWQLDLDLGGPSGVRHELRLGLVDPATSAALQRFLADHPGEPLEGLPEGFWDEATLVVTKR
jgi:LPXTG-site transpeptidase (sortase) family protein